MSSAPPMPEVTLPRLGPCEEPCEKTAVRQPSKTKKLLLKSFFNAMDVCFDDVYEEPKRILMVGGCRQRDFAQYIALLLPGSEIVLVDPDEQEVVSAKEEICCRFAFIHSSLEKLPFADDTFDLTFAHNFFAYPADWQPALSELGRVTRKNLMISRHRPLLWRMTRKLGALETALAECGIQLPAALPEQNEFLTRLLLHAKIKTRLAPYPWDLYMTAMRPDKQERLKLS